MPILSRINSCVPKQSMIDLKPLCPPCVPFGRIRIVPNGNARSSEMTISLSTRPLVFREQAAHRLAAQVHIGLRLGQLDRLIFNHRPPDQRAAFARV